jgi:hypothetical protein
MVEGASAGQITSVAELSLETGNRVFALGMMRAEAEAKNLPLSYEDGSRSGTARILDNPPKFG